MTTLDATIIGGVISAVLAMFKIIERSIDKRMANGAAASEATMKRAIFNTERNSERCVEISAKQTEILQDMKTALAIMSERDCPYGRRNHGG